ncbi:hypothetical protein CEXT_582051 [Caerostris extrusa]|uniref:Uncharacterized protein n=1 Tax=Caerostris extrusa TaxID=172846 RepID=A0AAV4UN90_CAEEX|nr:hypothetical protein CEXT_582051 [Caerostris extrusa]
MKLRKLLKIIFALNFGTSPPSTELSPKLFMATPSNLEAKSFTVSEEEPSGFSFRHLANGAITKARFDINALNSVREAFFLLVCSKVPYAKCFRIKFPL